jgi:hypothetical protein
MRNFFCETKSLALKFNEMLISYDRDKKRNGGDTLVV